MDKVAREPDGSAEVLGLRGIMQSSNRAWASKPKRQFRYGRGPSYLQAKTRNELITALVMKGRELRFYLAASDPGSVSQDELGAKSDEVPECFDPMKVERSKLIGQLFGEARNELALERKEEMMSNLRELTFRINRLLKQGFEDEQAKFKKGKTRGRFANMDEIERLYRSVGLAELHAELAMNQGIFSFDGQPPLPAKIRKEAGPMARWNKRKLIHRLVQINGELKEAKLAATRRQRQEYRPGPGVRR